MDISGHLKIKSLKIWHSSHQLYCVCFMWNQMWSVLSHCLPHLVLAMCPPNIPYTWPPSYTFIHPVKIHSKYGKSTCFQSNAAEICKRLEWAARLSDTCEMPSWSLSDCPQPCHKADNSSISDYRAIEGANIFTRKHRHGLCIVWPYSNATWFLKYTVHE